MANGAHPKSDVAQLKGRLNDAELKRDTVKYRATVQKIVAFMTLGIDVSPLFTDMIKACATQDLVQKKLAYLYICSHAEAHSDLALLTVNTLIKDTQDDNPMVRGLALRSMLNLRIPSLGGYIQQPLLKGLVDKSPYVKKNAILGCIKMQQTCPEVLMALNVVSSLDDLVYDNDVQVSFNALTAIEEILSNEGGLQFQTELVKYLLDRLYSYNEWAQCLIMHWLSRYMPLDQDETLYYLNVLDSRLKHTNKGVVMAAVNLFIQYTRDLASINSDVLERVRVCLLSAIPSASSEILYVILSHFVVLLGMKPRLFHADYKVFFLKSGDTTFVQQKKLELLVKVVTEGNVQFIMDELVEYVLNSDSSVSQAACSSIGSIALNHRFAARACLNAVFEMMANEVDHITSQCLEILQGMVISYNWVKDDIKSCLVQCWPLVQDHVFGKSALIWLLGECGEDIAEAPYYLEQLVDCINEEHSSPVKLQLLLACMKLFFKRPPECQHFLGRLLKFCIDEEVDMDVRDRAMLFYRSLVTSTDEAKAVVFSMSDMTGGNSKSSGSLGDANLSDFNTLAILYGAGSSSLPFTMRLNRRDSGEQEPMLVTARPCHSVDDSEAVCLNNLSKSVLTADLLGTLDEPAGAMHLDPNASISAQSFEEAWVSAPFSTLCSKYFDVIPTYDTFSHLMHSSNLFLIASSSPEDLDWRFYYFAKPVHHSKNVMIEVKMVSVDKSLTFVLKSEDASLLVDFERHVKHLCLLL